MQNKNLFSVLGSVMLALALIISSSPSTANAAAGNYYLMIDGIKGESTAPGHKGEMEIASWSFGANNSGSTSTGSALGTGKVSINSFNIMKQIDKASPVLFKASLDGNTIKSVSLSVRIKGMTEPLKIELENVMVSSYGMSSGGDRPMESISLSFSKITYAWPKPMTADSTAVTPAPTPATTTR